jgi:3',5'-cyclic AMP phosphodiesterase CpdA
MKFGVITDCQYADVDDSYLIPERHFRLAKEKLSEAVDFFNEKDDLEFIVHLGDFIDHDIKNATVLNEITNRLKKPLFHVLGNHDFYQEWPETIKKNSRDELIKQLNMPGPYYYEYFENYKFIFLDTNEIGVIEYEEGSAEYEYGINIIDKLKSQGKIYAQDWNGNIGEEQQLWLEKELNDARDKNLSVILFAHHQLFPEHRDQVLMPERITKFIDDYSCIKAYLNGHNHDGDFGVYDDVPCITFKGMLDTDENSYSIVELKENGLSVEGHGREESRKIKTRV